MITVSVPGKIHFMGEHAVVYGKPALLAAINKRMVVTIQSAKQMEIISSQSPEYVQFALDKVREYLNMETLPPLCLTIRSDIPAGFHLGSSAATAVGVVAATLYFVKKLWNPTVINHIAYDVEKKQHNNPSGGDNTTVTMGGFVWFRKELEFLKSMWQLDVTIPKSLNHFYLLDTGKPQETTGDMVLLVRKRFEKHPRYMNQLFSQNETQVKNIAVALKEQNELALCEGIRQGERTLEAMGVVGKSVIPCIRAIEKVGGAAKILGGGGRKGGVGFLLCYLNNKTTLTRIEKTFGFSAQPIVLGGQGVTLEQKE